MERSLKKTVSLILTMALLFLFTAATFAEGDTEAAENKKSFTLICSNVAGLPIPSFATSEKRSVPEAEKKIVATLNASGADIICVQEDFQYHGILDRGMTNYPYKTYTSGGIPVGDGLNVFSKYPIYNIDRVAWEKFNGILSAANDGFTPKGFLKFTADIDGVLIDIYNIHVDANGSPADCEAKDAQFHQLADYIKANSEGRAVLITGDFNATFHGDYLAKMYETMIVENGYTDSWIHLLNNDNYFRDADRSELVAYWNNRAGDYWGGWDSVERLLYKDGGGVKVNPTDFTYHHYDKLSNGANSSDHAYIIVPVELDAEGYQRPDMQLDAPQDYTLSYKITHSIAMVIRCLKLIFGELFVLLGNRMIGQ